jgi:D-amino peptidase
MKHRTILLAVGVAVAIVTSTSAQMRGLKVLLLYDMEGVSGAIDFRYTSFAHPDEYARGRKSLTADVNAAVSGLKAAGATEVVVVDGHGSGNSTGPDVLEDQLLAPAKMMYRDKPFDIYMDSYDESFDAIVAVAMHAGAGNSVGFLSHTYTFEDIEYKVNGVPFNESIILAMGAARQKIPLVMVSGDDQLEKEVRRHMPWVQYATVKHAVNRGKAESFSPDQITRSIETAARTGLQKLDTAKLPDVPGPYRFALTFQDEAQARSAVMLPGAELLSDSTVQVRSDDFEQGYTLSRRLIGLAVGPARNTASQAVLRAQPDADKILQQLNDWLYDRFLGTLAAPTSTASKGPTRYWGAQ